MNNATVRDEKNVGHEEVLMHFVGRKRAFAERIQQENPLNVTIHGLERKDSRIVLSPSEWVLTSSQPGAIISWLLRCHSISVHLSLSFSTRGVQYCSKTSRE